MSGGITLAGCLSVSGTIVGTAQLGFTNAGNIYLSDTGYGANASVVVEGLIIADE